MTPPRNRRPICIGKRSTLAQGDLARRTGASRRGASPRRQTRTGAHAARLHARAAGRSSRRPSRHLERAIALQPDSPGAHYHLGVALWYSGAKDRATAGLRQSVKLDPAAGESHAFLGTVLRDERDWPGARVSLQRAIALLPPTAAVYVDLGITYLRARGSSIMRSGQFEAGLNLPPPSQPAPDWSGAIAALRQTLSTPPLQGRRTADAQRAEAHNVLGRLLGRAGASSDDVASAFRDAIRLASRLRRSPQQSRPGPDPGR